MSFSILPNEILLHILQSCNSISDLIALASTCHHLHSILQAPSNRLPTFFLALESQYGPIYDATRLVTHNESQFAHVPRPSPPQSFALLKQLIEVGKVANTWIELYPSSKWRGDDSASRRFLAQDERYRLRRACYRLWLYSLAFHTPNYSRTTRRSPQIIRTRAALLRYWPTFELAELLDLQLIFRQVLQSTVTPSNSAVLRRHKARHPDDPFPLVSVTHPAKYAYMNAHYASCQSSGLYSHTMSHFHSTPHTSHLVPFAPTEKYVRTQRELHGTTLEGWGDEITHYYVLEDMLKLNPSQLLYLYSSVMEATQGSYHAGQSTKGLVESFVASLDQAGLWFENNGETLGETVAFVVGERGGESQEVRAAVEEGALGIARDEGSTF